MIAIDINLVVRYLTGDHPDESPRARALIDAGTAFVPVTVMLEVEWVLRGAYGYAPAAVIDALRAFGGMSTFTVEDAALVAQALDRVAAGMDFADALHFGRAGHCDAFATFDRRFVRSAAAAGLSTVRDP